MNIKSFTFNAFAENTYVLYDETKECIIIDPGCSDNSENKILLDYLKSFDLIPVQLINTHCHIDHILGNAFVHKQFGLKLTAHKKEKQVLDFGNQTAMMYQIPYTTSPDIEIFIDEGDTIKFGNSTLDVLFTPGHSPASISLYNASHKILIAGDVLFQGSIGRTDLPGGNTETLLRVIKNKFFNLPDETVVYAGHGDSTTIGIEKRTNPFF